MPLLKGNTPEVIAENIAQLVREGRDQKQAIAIAYREAQGGGKAPALKPLSDPEPDPTDHAEVVEDDAKDDMQEG
jgi:hypothetical protein